LLLQINKYLYIEITVGSALNDGSENKKNLDDNTFIITWPAVSVAADRRVLRTRCCYYYFFVHDFYNTSRDAANVPSSAETGFRGVRNAIIYARTVTRIALQQRRRHPPLRKRFATVREIFNPVSDFCLRNRCPPLYIYIYIRVYCNNFLISFIVRTTAPPPKQSTTKRSSLILSLKKKKNVR